MKVRETLKIYVGDFETTVYKNPIRQKETEVWASGLCELYTENAIIHNCIEDTFDFFMEQMDTFDFRVYYHNLKFDGSFWLSFLMTKLKLKPALKKIDLPNGEITYKMKSRKEMKNNEFICAISSMGQWYSITIKMRNHFLELRDSLKLIPTSVERMGKSYKTKHQKLEMDYMSDTRHAGGEITQEEKKYLINDLFVVKEVLEIMFNEGHNRLTIGACCMHEFRQITGKDEYEENFPNLAVLDCKIKVDPTLDIYFKNFDDYIRRGYKGGWCYLKKEYSGLVLGNGITADVNSLYPGVMHSDSGNYYPVGMPHEWEGNYIPKHVLIDKERYYFVRIKCKFKLKEGYLPTIQIKNNWMYKANEWLETSDIRGKDGNYYDYYIDLDGNKQDAKVVLTLSCTDYNLFLEHYNVFDLEILDGCWFYAKIGLFDEYIDKYRDIKEHSEGAVREIAKLYLNNLYGKLAASTNSSFKFPFVEENGVINYKMIEEADKQPGYIAAGAAVTSYARYFTITHAQKNYKNFVYADTDSIHCVGLAKDLKDIKVHPSAFGCWKLEATWDMAIFIRQKTYIEHVYEENLKPVKEIYYNIKCAGMPKRCKELFNAALLYKDNKFLIEKHVKNLNKEERKFFEKKYELKDFNLGLVVPSKLLPRRVKGGIVLTPSTYQMR